MTTLSKSQIGVIQALVRAHSDVKQAATELYKMEQELKAARMEFYTPFLQTGSYMPDSIFIKVDEKYYVIETDPDGDGCHNINEVEEIVL